jgi:hypothetical protein
MCSPLVRDSDHFHQLNIYAKEIVRVKSALWFLLPLIFGISACTPPSNQVNGQSSEVMSDSFFSGQALLDANNNGEIDPADMPLPGATFIVRDNRGAEFGAVTDTEGKSFVTFPGGSQYPVTVRMEPPKDNSILRVNPEEAVLQNASGETVQFLFFNP